MRHKRKNNKWRRALWALLSLILIGAVPVSAGSESAQNSGKGTVVFTERAIGGGPYRVNVMLTRTISDSLSIPVIASGGAGSLAHFYDALTAGGAEAALAASLFHYKELEIREVKEYLRDRGIPVRL